MPRILRNYRIRSPNIKCTVLDALIAAISDPRHVLPVAIGDPSEDFISASQKYSNPTHELVHEAIAAFRKSLEQSVASVVSLGIGHPGPPTMSSMTLEELTAVAGDAERVAEEFKRRCGSHEDIFYRLSMAQGAADIFQTKQSHISTFVTHCKAYLGGTSAQAILERLVNSLQQPNTTITLQRLGESFSRERVKAR